LRDRGRRWTLPRWLASLAYTSPGRSHLFPLTPILDELHGRGHQIVLRTLASQVSSMRARGFDVEPISAPIETIELDDWRARNSLQSVRQNARTFCARAEHDAPDLERAVADIDPDALLVDINSWGGLMVFVIAASRRHTTTAFQTARQSRSASSAPAGSSPPPRCCSV
jgi:hypothetical protein